MCYSTKTLAQDDGFGGMAHNILGSVNFVSDFVYSACVIIGSAFIFAAIVKYIEHRRSPLLVPISTVVFLLIAGVLLLLLPLLSYIYSGALPYSLYEED